MKYFFLTLLYIALTLGQAFGLEIPALSGPVVDQAGVYSPSEKQKLSDLALELLKKGGPQFQILTIPSLDGEVIEDYSIKVVEQWKLGTKDKGNGLLLIIALNDRKMRIEVGQGIEGEITDAESSRYINEVLKPAFRQKSYFEGTVYVMASVGEKFGIKLQHDTQFRKARGIGAGGSRVNWLIILLFIFFVIFRQFRGMSGSHYRQAMRGGSGTGYYGTGMGGGYGSGGSSSGSSWGGGGGGFSGGGSSGDW